MNAQDTLYTIALSMIPSLGLTGKRLLADVPGGAATIFEFRNDIRTILPDASQRLVDDIAHMDSLLGRAEQEMEFAGKGNIRILCIGDGDYPHRLARCEDAPIVLYYRGNADLNGRHVVGMVGTRRVTQYGIGFCQKFVAELKDLCPDALVVSGLAYGVDVNCHRNAMKYGLPTVGVLAHGLDQIYPRGHRETAIEMQKCGGVLTEFPAYTPLDKRYFLQRNRIIAGMSDAAVVVESAMKGGSLRTAEYAGGYNRDVFAVPGRLSDPMSEGCNALIAENKAVILCGAAQLVADMGWEMDATQRKSLRDGIQQELFPTLTEEEGRIASSLSLDEAKGIDRLSCDTGINPGKLGSLLFGMEMKGVARKVAGGGYVLAMPR